MPVCDDQPPKSPSVVDEEEEGEEEYEVETIIDKRYNKKAKEVEYKVKWRGYGPEFDTWEPETNLKDTASEVLAEFLAQEATRKTPNKPEKAKRVARSAPRHVPDEPLPSTSRRESSSDDEPTPRKKNRRTKEKEPTKNNENVSPYRAMKSVGTVRYTPKALPTVPKSLDWLVSSSGEDSDDEAQSRQAKEAEKREREKQRKLEEERKVEEQREIERLREIEERRRKSEEEENQKAAEEAQRRIDEETHQKTNTPDRISGTDGAKLTSPKRERKEERCVPARSSNTHHLKVKQEVNSPASSRANTDIKTAAKAESLPSSEPVVLNLTKTPDGLVSAVLLKDSRQQTLPFDDAYLLCPKGLCQYLLSRHRFD